MTTCAVRGCDAEAVITQVGGALHGGRNADPSARKLYEQPRDQYRP
ncbi:hypothetical protein [Microbacterium rhizosphaerae]|uniref:Uncharacterized protein n=1 Tax=Microbacterium rhizosphaerae TaxID=1678237 RepID=A0ABZ0SLH4_9MICO|nr:hypothetical protein [Microbacterium rhizosphaerae]WPR90252.1 hypothetical protein SM116_02910 [Microbacterium rhizosphaerae]